MTQKLMTHFNLLTDPRIDRTKLYSLEAIMFQTIAAVVSDADTWVGVEEFGKAKRPWLEKYVSLPHGTPSHDTLGDLFKRLDPSEFQQAFLHWTKELSNITEGELIAIDGKCLRGSHDRYTNKSAIHLISAWANSNELVLGQYKVDDKSNEVTAIPKLLNLLDIKGAIISIDAMGCQKEIAKSIVDKQADYILAVKDNQQTLYEQIKHKFKLNLSNHDTHINHTKSHGRIEKRRVKVFADLRFVEEALHWKEAQSIVEVETYRENISVDKISSQKRYYISSLKASAEKFNDLIRSHWSIENKLHWVLDVNFNEDGSRIRKGHADQNMAVIKRIALNMIKQHNNNKMSMKRKRYKAALDDTFRQEILII